MEIRDSASFVHYYRNVRKRTRRLVELIPEDRMEDRPIPGKFSFGDLVRHLGAIERFLYAENVRGRPSRYRGCGTDLAEGKNEILGFFDRCHEESIEIFGSLTEGDLEAKCTTPAGAPITVWKWLRLLPEHEIHHRGQLYSYLALIGVPTPPLYGLTSEQVASVASD